MTSTEHERETSKLANELERMHKEMTETEKQEKEEIKYLKSWRPKVTYAVIGVIIFLFLSYVYNSRGGDFLVRACKEDKCYTLRANLSAEWRAGSGTLYFSNGGSVHFQCSEDFGCEDTDGNNWDIHKTKRL